MMDTNATDERGAGDLGWRLRIEAEAARTLMLNVKDVIGDDEGAIADAIEGETSLREAIADVLERIADLETHEEAIAMRLNALKERKSRFSAQAGRMRTALAVAMATAGLRKLELPEATVSLRAAPPSVVMTEEADIPSTFWKPQPPKLDKTALLMALKSGPVPGASLSNGGETISIRTA
jgi:hypothetical protein